MPRKHPLSSPDPPQTRLLIIVATYNERENLPELVGQLEELLREVDFLSVGSNDLMQFLFAADRGDPRMAQRFDPLCSTMLRLIYDLQVQASEAKVPLTFCGEMAGNSLDCLALVGSGVTQLSMAWPALTAVRQSIASCNQKELADFLSHLRSKTNHQLRPLLKAFAHDKGINV